MGTANKKEKKMGKRARTPRDNRLLDYMMGHVYFQGEIKHPIVIKDPEGRKKASDFCKSFYKEKQYDMDYAEDVEKAQAAFLRTGDATLKIATFFYSMMTRNEYIDELKEAEESEGELTEDYDVVMQRQEDERVNEEMKQVLLEMKNAPPQTPMDVIHSTRGTTGLGKSDKQKHVHKTKPAAKPVAKPVTKPAAKPIAKPVAKPVEKPVTKPGGPPPKRHRKVLRDNIQGITKSAIRHLMRKGGIKRTNRDVYEEVRACLKVFVNQIIEPAINYAEYDQRKTVKISDVSRGLRHLGKTMYGVGM